MIEDVKVSFIVPVYNVEKYVKQCLDSISKQTYNNLEIIVIDDGTPDASGKIADLCATKDNRIKVIHKINQGVSAARNDGLKIATGEYIIFVDSDDYIEPDYTEYMLNLIESSKTDIAVSLNCFNERCSDQIKEDKIEIYSPVEALEAIYLYKIGVAVWNKIYRRIFLQQNNILFCPDLWFAEGMTFNIECFQVADKVATGLRRVYHQRYNPESAVRKFNINNHYCGLHALEYQKKIWRIQDNRILNAWNFHNWNDYFSLLKEIIKINAQEQYKKEIKLCKRMLRVNIVAPLKVNLSKKFKIFCFLVFIMPSLGAKVAILKESFPIIDE